MSKKLEISKLADACGLEIQIQSNMPGLRFALWVADEERRMRTGSVLYYGGASGALAFLEGYQTAVKHYIRPAVPSFPTDGICPACKSDEQSGAFDVQSCCYSCGWRPECPVCHTEI